jgi:hypothetical protein
VYYYFPAAPLPTGQPQKKLEPKYQDDFSDISFDDPTPAPQPKYRNPVPMEEGPY